MKPLILAIIAIAIIGSFQPNANAQMMGNFSNSTVDWNEIVEHTAREEREGKELWNKLQAKQLECPGLSDQQFGILGEYFMGIMTGASHASMNAMMIQMHGQNGEEQIHLVMGKRLSGCDASAAFPVTGGGWLTMMNLMWGVASSFNNTLTGRMMNFGPLGGFGWILMVLWWLFIILAIIALVKWLTHQLIGRPKAEKSALTILKERYAKGEIDKKEFEERKKDLI